VWPARIRRRVFHRDFTQYHVDWDGRRLIVRSAASEPMAEGEEVFVSADPRDCVLLEEYLTPADQVIWFRDGFKSPR
jgi:hypothetical protein